MRIGMEILESRRLFSMTLYTIADVGTLGGATSVANAINASGQVVGRAQTKTGFNDAFLWNNGTLTDLGPVGGTFGNALALNATEQTVGTGATGNESPSPTVWIHQSPTVLSNVSGSANGINDAGVIVGTAVNRLGENRAFRAATGSTQLTDLGTLGGADSQAMAINDADEIVGQAQTSSGNEDAFLVAGKMHDLGSLDGNATATALNNVGTVVGYSYDRHSRLHAFYWRKGRMIDIGTLAGSTSEALAVNDANTIVGFSTTGTQFDHAFIWIAGKMTDLNTLITGSGWTLAAATGINNAGQIVGYGSHNGKLAGFVLTPIPTPGVSSPALQSPTGGDIFAGDRKIGDAQSVLD